MPYKCVFSWCSIVQIYNASMFSLGYTSLKKKMCTIQIFKRFLFGKCLILLSTAVPAATGPESVVAVVVTVGGHSSTLCWLFRLCWSFVDRRDRCWLQNPFRSEPRLILHEAGEVALNKMVSTQCARWNADRTFKLYKVHYHFRRTAGLFRGKECIVTFVNTQA